MCIRDRCISCRVSRWSKAVIVTKDTECTDSFAGLVDSSFDVLLPGEFGVKRDAEVLLMRFEVIQETQPLHIVRKNYLHTNR